MPGINLNFKKIGSGRPLIILHGLLGSLDNWQSIANDLQKDYTIFLVDLRNHGRSPHTVEMNYSLMAADIEHFIVTEKIHSVGVIGHSMGGKVVLELIKSENLPIRKSMVVDIAPKAYTNGHEEIFRAMLNLDLSKIHKRSDAEDQISMTISSPIVCQFILKNLERQTNNTFNWKLNLEGLYKNYSSIASPIVFSTILQSKIQFLLGEWSDYVNEYDKSEILKILPNATFHIVKGAGHWLHAEKPIETIESIRNYFCC